MRSPRTVAGRIGRILAVCAFALTVAPSLPVSAWEPEPLDYPAALIYPEDAARAGFDDYGLVLGWYVTPEDMILSVVNQGVDEDEVRAEIEASGIRASYHASLHPITEPKDGELHGIAIESAVVQFDSEELASGALETLVTAIPGDDYDVVTELPELGDESFYISYQLEPGQLSPQAENTVEMGIRIGDVLGSVVLRGLGERIEIDLDQAEQMAEILEEKLGALVDGDPVGTAKAPNLSQIMPDYYNDVLCVCRIQYMIYGGEAIDLAYRADELEARQQLAEDYGIQSQFYLLMKPATRNDAENDPSLRIRVTRFNRANDAAAYVESAPDWMQDFPEQPRAFENVQAAIEYGDVDGYESAIALSYETEGDYTGAELEGTALYVQDGRYVYEVSLDGLAAPEIDALLDVVDQLEGCRENACVTTDEVPESVMDYFIEQAEIAAGR